MMDDKDRWFPVARCEEVVPRHVVQAQLFGQEIALWRDDAGRLNAWENRCPHRGVRLSIGLNDGKELRCQYHGWRYASGTGQCTFIPAHPDQKPSNVIKTKQYGVAERYGFVWVIIGDATDPPALDINAWTTLRSAYISAAASAVAARLKVDGADSVDEFIFVRPDRLVLLLQPVSEDKTILHGLVAHAVAEEERMSLLRQENERFGALRDALERWR